MSADPKIYADAGQLATLNDGAALSGQTSRASADQSPEL
jgi:hypothetical protein